jgi:NADH-ubiquinone oxidoreductase chain 2
MAGIPPLIGFFSKQFVLYSAIESGYYFISIVAIIVSVISASYYLYIIRLLHTATPDDHLTVTVSTESRAPGLASDQITFALPSSKSTIALTDPSCIATTQVSSTHSYTISILTLFILLFILKPSIILSSTQLLSLNLYYF